MTRLAGFSPRTSDYTENVMRTALACLAICAAVQPAMAGDHHHRRASEVDFDSLKAEVHPFGREWEIRVSYCVQVEHPAPGERLTLQLTPVECGAPLLDDKDRPVTIEVPLDRPTDVDDDELEFKGGLRIALPIESIRFPDEIELRGDVVDADNGIIRDTRDTHAKFCGRIVVRRPATVVEVRRPTTIVEVRRPAVHVRVYGRW
ncbi:MAG: hypothetical protein U1D55_14600 [Phycisphaerae bacterium]